LASDMTFIPGENKDSLSVEEVSDIERFRSLRESWHRLLGESGENNIFLTWEWLFTWWQHYRRDKKLRILLIKDAESIIAIAPLMQSRYKKGFITVDVVENICSSKCGYSGIILTKRQSEAVETLVQYFKELVVREKIIVRISNIPEKSSFLVQFQKNGPEFSKYLFLNTKPVAICPYITLPATWEEFLHTLSKKRRGNLRRAMESLRKNFRCEFAKYSNSADLRNALQTLFELHRQRWQSSYVGKKFTKSETRNFYTDITESFSQNNWLDFSFLKLDGKPVSACWCLIYDRVFYYETIAFDPNYAEYSVGTLHLMQLIENAIKNGGRKFDFLQGAETYKAHWTQQQITNFQINMVDNTFRGRYRILLLKIFKKLDAILSRSLRENYSLYLSKKRREKERMFS
jgi:CelD/BcsL family acetyltransferase involved in cellulose biosynthesis